MGYGIALDTGYFVYEDSEWGDRFVATQQSTATEYDSMGNPLTYYSYYIYDYPEQAYNFTWDGRRLATANYNGKTMSYTYNDDGIRTSKTVNGVTTTYHLNGSQIIAEETDTYIIVYLYDAAGSPIGMQYREFTYNTGVWDTYFYEKNLQGDIVAIYDINGTKLATYSYYAYGSGSPNYKNGGANTGAAKNPFMYRGYYFDSELNLYYLNSRYYDPGIGRFINPDSFVSTGQGLLGYNMYAYCNNSPVKYVDCYGEFPIGVIIVVGVLCWFGIANLTSWVATEESVSNKDIKPMDDEKYKAILLDGDTSNMTREDQIAFVRKTREVWASDESTRFKLDEWTEGEMLRELAYHDKAYQLIEMYGIQSIDLKKRLKKVDFEDKQSTLSYVFRMIGNMLWGGIP